MTYFVTMGDQGEITLPVELIADLSLTSRTPLQWRVADSYLHLDVLPPPGTADQA